MNPDRPSQNEDALKLEFVQLVRLSRQFLISKCKDPRSYLPDVKPERVAQKNKADFCNSTPEATLPKKISGDDTISPPKQEIKQVEIETPKPSIEKLPKIGKKKEIKSTNWELHPMSPTEAPTLFKQKLAAHCSTCEPAIPVKFLLPEENPQDRLFLENVSRAVTRIYAPARVLLFKEQLLQDPHTTYLFAPVVLLQKQFDDACAHTSFSHKGITILPMDSLELYSQNMNLKRALWAAIQHLFQS